MDSPFRILRPTANTLPLIFDSPHSGRDYPEDFGYACALDDLRTAEDHYVDELFAAAPDHSSTLLCAHFPRSYIDVNRAVTDIDPRLLSRRWPYGPPHGPIAPSPRSDFGIGLIRRLVRPGLPVYSRRLSPEEILHRIAACYEPYQAALADLITQAHDDFGQVWHINCHSMPSDDARIKNIDFVLSDREGRSCDSVFTKAVRECLTGMGYRVAINDPFKGAELIRRHADPSRGRHSLQIEINKALYMDETTGEILEPRRSVLLGNLRTLIAHCAEFVRIGLLERLAAD